MTIFTHEADGIDVLVSPIAFDAGTATTMIGAVVKAYALNKTSGVAITGAATVISATSIRATFSTGTVPAGVYSVQVIATPTGYLPQTVYDENWQVLKSGGPA